MKKIVFLVSILFATVQYNVNAQCVVCLATVMPTGCSSFLTNHNGFNSCTCYSGGCSCVGLCVFEGGEETFLDIDTLKDDDFTVPTSGLIIAATDDLDQYFINEINIGMNINIQIDNRYRFVRYRLDDNRSILYPISNGIVEIFSPCTKEVIFTTKII